jgi:5-methylcytosine-specific restriction protein A
MSISTWNKGIPMREETKQKMVATRRANNSYHLSVEAKAKVSKSLIGNKRRAGTKQTEECKKIISQKMMGNQYSKGIRPKNYIDGRSKTMGPGRYGDDWDKIRYMVYLRDNFTCQRCGILGKSLDVHHKKPFLQGGLNTLDNLISLCRSCHMKEEKNLLLSRED